MKNAMKKTNKVPNKPNEMKTLLTFLKRTKEGKYAQIEKSSLRYSRIQAEAETNILDEVYSYGLN